MKICASWLLYLYPPCVTQSVGCISYQLSFEWSHFDFSTDSGLMPVLIIQGPWSGRSGFFFNDSGFDIKSFLLMVTLLGFVHWCGVINQYHPQNVRIVSFLCEWSDFIPPPILTFVKHDHFMLVLMIERWTCSVFTQLGGSGCAVSSPSYYPPPPPSGWDTSLHTFFYIRTSNFLLRLDCS